MNLDPHQKRLYEQMRVLKAKWKRESPEDRWKFLLKIGLIDKEGRVQMGPRPKRRRSARKARTR